MKLWRVCKTKHAGAPLDGQGGLFVEGRWHVQGTRIVYMASTPSLAALETLAHTDSDLVPPLTLVGIDAPDTVSLERVDPSGWGQWRAIPFPKAVQAFGSEWVRKKRSVLLQVPSVCMPYAQDVESNYLMNPSHPDASQIRVVERRSFSFDPRLIRKPVDLGERREAAPGRT